MSPLDRYCPRCGDPVRLVAEGWVRCWVCGWHGPIGATLGGPRP